MVATAVCRDQAGQDSEPKTMEQALEGDLAENPTPRATGVTFSSAARPGQINPVKGEASTFDVPIANRPIGGGFEVQFSWNVEPPAGGQAQGPDPPFNTWIVVPTPFQPKFTPTEKGMYKVTVKTRLNNTATGVAGPADHYSKTITVDEGRQPTIRTLSPPTVPIAHNAPIPIEFTEVMDKASAEHYITIDGKPIETLKGEGKIDYSWDDPANPKKLTITLKNLEAKQHELVIGPEVVSQKRVNIQGGGTTISFETTPVPGTPPTPPTPPVAFGIKSGNIVVEAHTDADKVTAKIRVELTGDGTKCTFTFKELPGGAPVSVEAPITSKISEREQVLNKDKEYEITISCKSNGDTATWGPEKRPAVLGTTSLTAAAPPAAAAPGELKVTGGSVDGSSFDRTIAFPAPAADSVDKTAKTITVEFDKDLKAQGEQTKWTGVTISPDDKPAGITPSISGKTIVFAVPAAQNLAEGTEYDITIPAGILATDGSDTKTEVKIKFITAGTSPITPPTTASVCNNGIIEGNEICDKKENGLIIFRENLRVNFQNDILMISEKRGTSWVEIWRKNIKSFCDEQASVSGDCNEYTSVNIFQGFELQGTDGPVNCYNCMYFQPRVTCIDDDWVGDDGASQWFYPIVYVATDGSIKIEESLSRTDIKSPDYIRSSDCCSNPCVETDKTGEPINKVTWIPELMSGSWI